MAFVFPASALFAVTLAGPTLFLSALEDVPLPPAVVERADSLATFEGPQGRIVTLQAEGDIAPNTLSAFYDTALPQLGWKREGAVFVRDRARLTITFRREGAGLIITYRMIEGPASLALE